MSKDVLLYDSKGNPAVTMERRNMAFSEILREKMPRPSWTNWTVKKAVKEGLRSSVWIFRSFGLITGCAASVPLRVVDKDSLEPVENHKLSTLLEMPNTQISRKDCMSLIYNWLLLSGLAYFYKGKLVQKGKVPTELWPFSPDRLAPVRSRQIDLMIEGYVKAEKKSQGAPSIDFLPEQIIPFRIMDPANPLLGISPLFAAARIIDTDTEMQKFNKAAMQNRGVVDGFISFKQPMAQTSLDTQVEAWDERHGGSDNARRVAFLAGEAEYHRMSMTPAESDFGKSRKDNRDEILSACGTPPQLVGALEASTMDNYRTSETIHWRNTIVPLIDIVAIQLAFSFRVQGLLKDNETIAGDYSNVQALQQNFKEKTAAAEKLFKIGTPVKTINDMLKLGIDEFEGWGLPYNGRDVKINPATGNPTQVEKPTEGGEGGDGSKVDENKRTWMLKPFQTRDIRAEAFDREEMASKRSKAFSKILRQELKVVEDVLDESPNPLTTLRMMFQEEDPFESQEVWVKELTRTAKDAAMGGGKSIVIQARAFEDELATAIDTALEKERTVLLDYTAIHTYTIDKILEQVQDGLNEGLAMNDIKAALVDTGAFSPERALRIARTTVGTASSMGQLAAGQMSGATHKTWRTAGSEVRELHQTRDGERVPINEEFTRAVSSTGAYPRYPLDPNLGPEDRINCRCSMDFD